MNRIQNTAIIATLNLGAISRRIIARSAATLSNDRGMSTIEYAFGSLAAAALAGVLYIVVNGNGVTTAIESVITDALNNRPK